MIKDQPGPFHYLSGITASAVLLIILNAVTGMHIPFRVEFLIGFVGALMVFVIWHSVLTKGWQRTVWMMAFSFVIAFSAEALGVNFGLIFGHYHYTQALGLQFLGVPFLAALAWEPILYAAFSLTDILAPSLTDHSSSWLQRMPIDLWMAVIGALATTAWDMMIDPIAVSQGWWVWEEGGAYLPYLRNGVPVQNFLGWLGVAFTINLVYRSITNHGQQPRRSLSLSLYGPLVLYSSLFLTSFGVTLTILARSEVALVGLLAMGPFLAIALTNLNLVRYGLAALLNTGWLENPNVPQSHPRY